MKTTKLMKLIARKLFSPIEEDSAKHLVSTPEIKKEEAVSMTPTHEAVNQLMAEIHHNPFTYAMRAQLLRNDIKEIELVSMAKTTALLFRLQRLGCHGIELHFKFDEAGPAPWQHCWLQWHVEGQSFRLDPLFFDQMIEESLIPESALRSKETAAENALDTDAPVAEDEAAGQLVLAS